MPDAVRAVVRAWDDIDPGDVFIHNDPYFGGSHLPDVNVVSPAFVDGSLLGFCCVRAHWPDVGSATPGSYGAVTEVYGEGLRLPPVRIHRAGSVNRDVEDLIFTNVRTPVERRGDLRAQIAGQPPGLRPPDRPRPQVRDREPPAHHAGGDGLLRGDDAGAPRRDPGRGRVVRRLLRRGRDHRARRQPGRDVRHPAEGRQARRHPQRRFHWLRPPGRGTDERPALGHRVRSVHRAQDGDRFGRGGAPQFRGVAPGAGSRPGGGRW